VRATRLASIEVSAALAATITASICVTGVLAGYAAAVLQGLPVGAQSLLLNFSNPRFPAQLQALTIPLLPLAARLAPTRFWRVYLIGVASLWWMCLIGSASRTAWIALTVAALLIPFFGVEGRRWLKWQLLFALIGAALWIALFHVMPSLLGIESTPETGRFSEFGSMSGRLRLWQQCIDAALAHPLLGIGPMHFAYINKGEAGHPHNFWLQMAAEWGIPAALLIGGATLALIAALARKIRAQTDAASRGVGIALLAAIIAWSVGTLADGYMVIPTSQAMSAVVFALAMMWLRLGCAPAHDGGAAGNRIVAVASTALLAIALTILIALPATQFGRPVSRAAAWRGDPLPHYALPRFWQQGLIGPDADATAGVELGSGEARK
jgi:O-antigen ligase